MTVPPAQGNHEPLRRAFQSSTFHIRPPPSSSSSSSSQDSNPTGLHSPTSSSPLHYAFFRDSSRRARVKVSVQMMVGSMNEWQYLLRSGMLDSLGLHPSENVTTTKNHENSPWWKQEQDAWEELGSSETHPNMSLLERSALRFECDCENPQNDSNNDNNHSNPPSSLTVEGVSVSSCELVHDIPSIGHYYEKSILFHLEIILRDATPQIQIPPPTSPSSSSIEQNDNNDYHDDEDNDNDDDDDNDVMSVNSQYLEQYYHQRSTSLQQPLSSLFSLRAICAIPSPPPPSPPHRSTLPHPDFLGDVSIGLRALESGASVISSPPILSSSPMIECTSPRLFWNTKCMWPLTLSIREVGGARAASGATLVSLTIAHSNHHPFPVTIHQIALHPGHSRRGICGEDRSSLPGGAASIVDMARQVRWGYVKGTTPMLPLILQPHEAISTVLQMDASEHPSPPNHPNPNNHPPNNHNHHPPMLSAPLTVLTEVHHQRTLMTSQVHYTTSRIVSDMSDAFRMDMSLLDARYKVGAPLIVNVRVMNMSHQDRDLMLLMAKDEDKSRMTMLYPNRNMTNKEPYPSSGGGSSHVSRHSHTSHPPTPTPAAPTQHSVNTAVVSEVNGYTFGVWGLAGDDDGTTRHNRDHELLAVDAALLLGEVKGQHTMDAELRFVPLREGTLDVPNLRLYDKLSQKWYSCVHMLKIVAAA